MSSPRHWRPVFIENSRLPVWLSKVAPIRIWALSLAVWVFCRGELAVRTRTHETIHFQQQLELLFVGQWILYGLFYLLGLIRWRKGSVAYRLNPFEQEAFDNDDFGDEYLDVTRRRYSWLKYLSKFLTDKSPAAGRE